MTPADVKAVRAVIAQARMSTYDNATSPGPDRTRRALALYLWNVEVAAAFFVPLNMCEVAIRNAVSDAIAVHYGPRWPWSPGFRRSLPDPAKGYSPQRDLINASRTQSSTGKVIPEVKFVFWQRMFTSRHDMRLWTSELHAVLPNAPLVLTTEALREQVYDDLDRIRLLRNRIAHHEPIFSRGLADDLAAITELIALRSTPTRDLLAQCERVTTLLTQRPA